MKTKNKKKIIIIICTIVILIAIAVCIYFFLFRKVSTKNKVVDNITSYGYTLDNRDTALMKEKFNSLKEELNKEQINFENYAKLLTELFVIDLYTIDNKNGSYDVGGVEYIYPDARGGFEINARNTLYQYVSSKDKRKEEMPEVTSTEIKEIEKSTFTYNEEELESYDIKITWDYKKNLGYDTEALIRVFRKDNILYIGEVITEVEND